MSTDMDWGDLIKSSDAIDAVAMSFAKIAETSEEIAWKFWATEAGIDPDDPELREFWEQAHNPS